MNKILLTALLFLPGMSTAGEPPLPFELGYSASYSGLKAQSQRSLQKLADGSYRMDSETSLRILGAELSHISETSTFDWSDGLPVPRAYSYVQSGIGSRERSLDFDHAGGTATWHVDERTGTIEIDTPLYDDLNSFLVLRELLSNGMDALFFDVVDKDSIKHYHYEVLDREPLQTELGIFKTVHVERIRDEGSERHTEFWLAEDHEYILLKFLQTEPGEKEIRLVINAATVDGNVLAPDPDKVGI